MLATSPSSTAGGDPARLLERASHLATLNADLTSVRESGRGKVVFVGGEAGVGKTSLVRHFTGALAPIPVLAGACDALFTPRPLGPFLDMGPLVGGEFQALAERGARAHQIASALLRALAASPPTVLIIEDVHWADEATLDVLRFLGRRIETAPALVLVTFRDELDRAHPFRILLGELTPSESISRMHLPPLSHAAVAVLAEPHGVDGAAIYRLTSGNPFFVTEVLAAGTDAIPPNVRDAVFARIARLPAKAIPLLEAVAVVPQQTELWLLDSIAGTAIDYLDVCLSAGILAETDGCVHFRHELARLAIEEALPPVHRSRLHRRVLRALENPPFGDPYPARLVHHARAAADVDAILRFAPVAGERAARVGAHREAAAHYALAVRFADALDSERRADLLDRLSQEHYLSGHIDEAVEPCTAALAIWRATNRTEKIGYELRRLSRLYWFLGNNAEARRHGLAAVDALETLPPGRELAMAYGNLAHLGTRAADSAETLQWGRRAIELAEGIGDRETVCYALNSMGTIESGSNLEHGRALLERSLAIALEHGFEEHAARAYANLAVYLSTNHTSTQAEIYLRDGLSYCAEHDLGPWGLFLRWVQARTRLDQGDWTGAAEDAAAVLGVPWTSFTNRIPALLVLGRVRARRGDPGVAPLLDEARDLTLATGELLRNEQLAAVRAEWRWLAGDLAGCAREAEVAFQPTSRMSGGWYNGEVAIWLWRGGGLREAPAAIALPYALEIAGQWQAAASEWERLGCPYEQALALMDGDEEALRAAGVMFERLGAAPAAEIVRQRLRARGARGLPRGPRPTTRTNPFGLTNRQLDILALLAEGLHNAEIADRLCTTPKTAEHHVSAVLAKLNARTRTEAVRLAYQRGLLPASTLTSSASGS